MLAHDSWAWGWDALVALGTLCLGAGTAWLAWQTRGEAKATKALADMAQTDLEAQARPVLVPGEEQPDEEEFSDFLRFPIFNAGRGPALDVRARWSVDGSDQVIPTAIGPGLTMSLLVEPPSATEEPVIVLTLSYADLAKNRYLTHIEIDGNDPTIISDVRVEPNKEPPRRRT